VRRREFIALLASAGVTWPLVARGQQPAMPVVGFLHSASAAAFAVPHSAKGLWRSVTSRARMSRSNIAGAKVTTSACPRWRRGWSASGWMLSLHRSAPLRRSRPRQRPLIGADPVKIGLVASLHRPGGNATGISDVGVELGAKRLGLLKELLPAAARFAVLVNPANPFITKPFVTELQTAASAIGQQIEVVTASTNSDIDQAFATKSGPMPS
jgi:putative ABC transport system substrate-binding protein